MSSSTVINLPSIHEMLPDHLLFPESVQGSQRMMSPSIRTPRSPAQSYIMNNRSSLPSQHALSSIRPSVAPPLRFEDVPRTIHESNASAYHRSAPPQPPLSPPLSAMPKRKFQPSPSDIAAAPRRKRANTTSSMNSTASGLHFTTSSEDDEEDLGEDEGDVADTTKKHICEICRKRFNRPSSLRIHRNTHTGATPYRCPWQDCGRAFNVNSNMRRHYRNHQLNTRSGSSGPVVVASSAPVYPPSYGAADYAPTEYDLEPRKRKSRTNSFPSIHSYPSDSPSLLLQKATWDDDERRRVSSRDVPNCLSQPLPTPYRDDPSSPSFQSSSSSSSVSDEEDEFSNSTVHRHRDLHEKPSRHEYRDQYPAPIPAPTHERHYAALPSSSARRHTVSEYPPSRDYPARDHPSRYANGSPYQAPTSAMTQTSDVRSQRTILTRPTWSRSDSN